MGLGMGCLGFVGGSIIYFVVVLIVIDNKVGFLRRVWFCSLFSFFGKSLELVSN